jgi:hypothetical protein
MRMMNGVPDLPVVWEIPVDAVDHEKGLATLDLARETDLDYLLEHRYYAPQIGALHDAHLVQWEPVPEVVLRNRLDQARHEG